MNQLKRQLAMGIDWSDALCFKGSLLPSGS